MKTKIYYLIFVMVIISLFNIGVAFAQKSYFPHQFYGSVTINNLPAPDGAWRATAAQGQDRARVRLEDLDRGEGRLLLQEIHSRPIEGWPGQDGGLHQEPAKTINPLRLSP